jgi:tetratricopeptide (TPR) repeat protein
MSITILVRLYFERKSIPNKENDLSSLVDEEPLLQNLSLPEKVWLLNCLGASAFYSQNTPLARYYVEKGLSLGTENGITDQLCCITITNNQATIMVREEKFEDAINLLTECFKVALGSFSKETLIPIMILNNLLCLFYITEKIYKIREYEPQFEVNSMLKCLSLETMTGVGDVFIRLYENYADVCYIMSGYVEARKYMDKCQNAYEEALKIKSRLYPEVSTQIGKSYSDIGNVLYDKMEYEIAIKFCKRGMEIRKEAFQGQNHLDVANSLSQLSRFYRVVNNDQQAFLLEEESVQMKDKLFPEPTDTNLFIASGLQQLARNFYNQQKSNEALEKINKAMSIIKKALGENCIKLANLYEDAGLVMLQQSNYKDALFYFQSALQIYRSIYGEDHFKIAMCIRLIGVYHKNLGDYSQALECFKKRLELICNMFSTNDTYAANAFEEIATIYSTQGQYSDSIQLHIKVLEIREAHFGKNSQFVADSLFNLASVKYQVKEFSEAFEFNSKALEIYQQQLGRHLRVAATYDSLGNCYSKQKKYEEAYNSYDSGLQLRIELFGPDHINISESYLALANYFTEKEDYENAIKFNKKSLMIYTRSLNEHPEIASILSDIGTAYRDKGEYDSAMPYYVKSLNMRIKLFGPENLAVGNSNYLIGINYHEKGEYNSAIQHYEIALELYLKLLGENRSKIANVYEVIGNAYYCLSNFPKAMENYCKTLKIREVCFSGDNALLGDSYYNIGRVLRRQGNAQKAVENYEKSLEIYIRSIGEDRTEVASVYEAIGNSHKGDGKYSLAMEFYYKSLNIRENLLGSNHKVVAQSYYNIGLVHFCLKEYKKALDCYLKVIKIYQKIYGYNHTMVSTAHETIGEVYRAVCDFEKAKIHFKMAYTISAKILGKTHNFPLEMKRMIDFVNRSESRIQREPIELEKNESF